LSQPWQQRTKALLGEEALQTLQKSRGVVLGLGGVGSAAAEALARTGAGHLLLVDASEFSQTNLNRQIASSVDVLGAKKAPVVQKRLHTINPDGDFTALDLFVLADNLQALFDFEPDFIVDAVDTVTTKLALARRCAESQTLLVMSMGTGGRLDPTALRTGTLADTRGTGCPLARVLRRELARDKITDTPVVYSVEAPARVIVESTAEGRHLPGSSPFVPPAAGFALASLGVRLLLGNH
jgi:tRNA A37 threonylcarbamoyladenosine dehydratase